MPHSHEIDWNKVQRFAIFCSLLTVFSVVIGMVYWSLLFPILVSVFLTFLLEPFISILSLKIPRWCAVALTLFFFFAMAALCVIRIISPIYREVIELLRLAPKVSAVITTYWLPHLREFLTNLGLDGAFFDQMVKEAQRVGPATEQLQQALNTILHTAPRVLGTVINLVTIPLLTFFMLKDYDDIKNEFMALVPPDLRIMIRAFYWRVVNTLRSVLKGQLIVAAIVGVMYVIGLNIVGIYAATAIGLVCGVCRIIPYLDILVCMIFASIVVFSDFDSVSQLGAVMIVILVVQTVDGMFVTPRVLGERLGIHPAIVILSILAFGNILGFAGVLLAIPIVAVGEITLDWYTALLRGFHTLFSRELKTRISSFPALLVLLLKCIIAVKILDTPLILRGYVFFLLFLLCF